MQLSMKNFDCCDEPSAASSFVLELTCRAPLWNHLKHRFHAFREGRPASEISDRYGVIFADAPS
jgi:hypothetical protein